jgi:4-hydroxy-3-methylbut-2-enyl diphosphate reductase
MGVKLAKTAGFCMGVKRAVDIVLDIAQHKGKENIYSFGPLIHNPQTIELLKKRGIIPIQHLKNIEMLEEGDTLILRTHGISPEERREIKEKGIKIIDATCPKVAHVQGIIKKHASMDYTILIIGDQEHPEVNALMGYASGKGVIINHEDELNRLPDLERVCVVAQTTQNVDAFIEIVRNIKARYPHALIFNTICDSTEKMQAEIKNLAFHTDAMIVIGGKNSANTKQLAHLSELQGTPTFHIETAEELENITLAPFKKIGISAGASTPNWIIEEVVDHITNDQVKRKKLIEAPLKIWLFTVRNDIYLSIGAGCLSLTSMLLQNLPANILIMLITSLYVYAMHTLNRLISIKSSGLIGSFRDDLYLKYAKLYIAIGILSMLVALGCSFMAGTVPFILLFVLSLAGVLYNAKFLPKQFYLKSLRDIPGSKNVSMALAWATVAAVLPKALEGLSITPGMVVAFLFTFSIVFIRSSMVDMLDIQKDRLIGKETIPVLIGEKNTRPLLKMISLFLLIILVLSSPAGWTSSLSFALLTCIFYIWICFRFCDRSSGLSGIILGGLLETSYIIAGASALIWLMLTKNMA